MQDLFRFMVQAARIFGVSTFCQSMMTKVFIVFMMVSLSRAYFWETETKVGAECGNSTMNLSLHFRPAFGGIVYQSKNYFTPRCSYTVPSNTTVTELELALPYHACGIKIEELGNRIVASTEVVVQMHAILDSVYDVKVNISCEIHNFHPDIETEDDEYDPFPATGLDISWIELKNGLVLFGESGEPTDSSLFLVVNVKDGGHNQDMIVQNCVAHSDDNMTDTSTLIQLSNFYGCPDPSAILGNFTVVRPGTSRVSMFAYAPLKNFSMIAARGRMSATCGLTLCENACPAHCNDTESPILLPLSDYATKKIVMRADGAVIPDSLFDLNRNNDRSRRAHNRPRRSIRSFFSSFFSWESSRTVSEGNATNSTSTGMAKRLLVKNVLVSARKPMNTNLTNIDSYCPQDRFCMDWQSFRFITLVTVCLFITVLACYCCYADHSKTKKGSHPFVF